jgi:hypothetical protein
VGGKHGRQSQACAGFGRGGLLDTPELTRKQARDRRGHVTSRFSVQTPRHSERIDVILHQNMHVIHVIK